MNLQFHNPLITLVFMASIILLELEPGIGILIALAAVLDFRLQDIQWRLKQLASVEEAEPT